MVVVVLSILSILGILGMTVLFPLLAMITSSRRSAPHLPRASSHPLSVDILIPAHNEVALLPVTLESIRAAIEEATRTSTCTFHIRVGADGCTDDSEAIARAHGAEVISTPTRVGKWQTINSLVSESAESDWIVLADCGVTWPSDFLIKLIPLLKKRDLIGVAPTYRNDESGLVERIIWAAERVIKRLESACGGPVSVHGATVCYRTDELRSTLQFLSSRRWLNDDVVIPLCMRALHPSMHLEYASHLSVNESAAARRAASSEFRRRRRLVHGNIEWITSLWGTIWKHNHVAALLASRRIFRLLWGYWTLCSSLTLALLVDLLNFSSPIFGGIVLGCTALAMCIRQLRTLLESCLASILTPYYLFTAELHTPNSLDVTKWN